MNKQQMAECIADLTYCDYMTEEMDIELSGSKLERLEKIATYIADNADDTDEFVDELKKCAAHLIEQQVDSIIEKWEKFIQEVSR